MNKCGVVFCLRGKVVQWGSYKGGFFEKLLEASLMSNRTYASWIQGEPAADQG